MRVVLQRVTSAKVVVAGETVGAIGRGWLALLGVAPTDTKADAAWLAEKTAYLRCFPDAEGKMNLSVLDIGGAVLAVSQFTLYGDCSKGRRPSFVGAARPEIAEPLYQTFVDGLRSFGIPMSCGVFGADMQVELTNDGPVTMIVDSRER
ncbi:MAG: D-tyrosyl-tRNA(Tyr) deacylase [Gemmataceae bacterium]|nr:D-tyrosyl-tRNA(Tyr) deacylase [Planctomycetia bacterium]MBX3400176.1 D-tyrosyl-tRNA(Tyr) deacylase [Gemmataceae bacterium]